MPPPCARARCARRGPFWPFRPRPVAMLWCRSVTDFPPRRCAWISGAAASGPPIGGSAGGVSIGGIGDGARFGRPWRRAVSTGGVASRPASRCGPGVSTIGTVTIAGRGWDGLAALCEVGLQRAGLMLLGDAIGRHHGKRDQQQPNGCHHGGDDRADIGQHGTAPARPAGETAEPEHRGRRCPGVKPADDP